jgi:hypothetical protein
VVAADPNRPPNNLDTTKTLYWLDFVISADQMLTTSVRIMDQKMIPTFSEAFGDGRPDQWSNSQPSYSCRDLSKVSLPLLLPCLEEVSYQNTYTVGDLDGSFLIQRCLRKEAGGIGEGLESACECCQADDHECDNLLAAGPVLQASLLENYRAGGTLDSPTGLSDRQKVVVPR